MNDAGLNFRPGVTAATLAEELAKKMFPDCSRYLYSDVFGNNRNRLQAAEATPKFAEIFQQLLAGLESEPGVLAVFCGAELPFREQIINTPYRRESWLGHEVWLNMRNEICDFMMAHTMGGEHDDIPARVAHMLEKALQVLKSAVEMEPPIKPIAGTAGILSRSQSRQDQLNAPGKAGCEPRR